MKQINHTRGGFYVDITCRRHSSTLLQYDPKNHALSCPCGFHIPLPTSWQWDGQSNIQRSDIALWYTYVDALCRSRTAVGTLLTRVHSGARKRLEKVLQRKAKQLCVYVVQVRSIEVEGVDWCGGGCKPTEREAFLVRVQ